MIMMHMPVTVIQTFDRQRSSIEHPCNMETQARWCFRVFETQAWRHVVFIIVRPFFFFDKQMQTNERTNERTIRITFPFFSPGNLFQENWSIIFEALRLIVNWLLRRRLCALNYGQRRWVISQTFVKTKTIVKFRKSYIQHLRSYTSYMSHTVVDFTSLTIEIYIPQFDPIIFRRRVTNENTSKIK